MENKWKLPFMNLSKPSVFWYDSAGLDDANLSMWFFQDPMLRLVSTGERQRW